MAMKAFQRMPAVQERVGGISRTTIYGRVKKVQFPKPVKIGGRVIAWLISDRNQWAEDPKAWQEQSEVVQ
ncbi:helix-turn-helix transcriptional regulator [Paenalcaligenes hominis]|uniref:helix-turn-helix transcriptional regulator n=1 Tax=Paenalcaligenes hominis TaxID=643674 RepID=UPI003524E9FA